MQGILRQESETRPLHSFEIPSRIFDELTFQLGKIRLQRMVSSIQVWQKYSLQNLFIEKVEKAMETALLGFKQGTNSVKGYPFDEEELTLHLLVKIPYNMIVLGIKKWSIG